MSFIIIGGSNNLVKNLTMYKIQLENSEFYKSKSGRVQHYRSTEKAEAKIKKIGEIAIGAIVVESKARTVAVNTENPEEIAPDTKVVKVSKTKKAAKAEKPEEIVTDPGEFVTDAEAEKDTIGKTKKAKKNKKT
jgi:hypothetical protein